jgi:hypothetical protein
LFGNGDHKPQVGLGEPFQRALIPLLDPLGERDFLRRGQQGRFPNLLEVQI